MKKTHLLLLLAAALSAPFLVTAAANRIATLPPFDSVADVGKTPTIKADGSGLQWSVASGVSGATGVSGLALAATGAVVANDLAAWAGTGGRQLKDSGIPLANVVLVSRAVQAGTGLTVTNSGLLSADITMSITSPVPMSLGGTSGITAASGFANLSPLTTKGDLIGYSTVPARLAVGTTGQILQSDSTQATGIGWTTDKLGVTTAATAATGYVGEVLSLSRTYTNAIALTTNVACNIGAATCPSTGGTQSITLTPGEWQISGYVGFAGNNVATNVVTFNGAVSKTSATFPANDTLALPTACEVFIAFNEPSAGAVVGANAFILPISPYRCNVSVNTPIYIMARSVFSAAGNLTYGYLEARRMR